MNSTPALLSPTPLTTSFYMNQDMGTKEDISTIFVVGFPEDMQEREFQNMFMFSPGFEAATLKLPSKDNTEDDYITNSNGGRKQIIGFAKFRSRKEALDARDILNGRKVDAEKGCMLKAEMAKKNLHTKRGLGEQQKNGGFSAYEAFYSVPPTHPYSNDLLLSPSTESNNDFYSDLLLMGSPPPSSVNSAFISRSHSVDARAADLFVKPSTSNNRFNIGRFPQASFSSDSLDYLSKSTPNDRNSFPLMNSFFNNNSNNHHHNSNTNNHKIASHPISPPLPPSTSTGLSRVIEEKFFKDSLRSPTTPISPLSSSPPTSGYRSLNNMILNSASSNPADQNPPCNTLYVGNLPPNTNEEELRLMFSKCLGYKRLSFKNKSNGPMCFVEFDDAIYAAQALQDLQGNPLSNSIKGGIRLSFSKNPLGVRQNPYTVNNNNSNNYFNNTFNSYRRESITTSAFDPQLS